MSPNDIESKEQNNNSDLSVVSISKLNETGRSILKDYEETKTIDTETRRHIVKLCCDFLVNMETEDSYYPTNKQKTKLAKSPTTLLEHFPRMFLLKRNFGIILNLLLIYSILA